MWFAHIDPCVSGCVGGLVLLLCNGRAGELWAVLWTSLGPLYVRPRAQPARQPVTLDIKTTFRTHIQAFGPKSQWKQNSEILDDDQKPNFHGDHKGAKDCHPIYHLSRLINITEEDCGWVFRKITHKHSQKEDVNKRKSLEEIARESKVRQWNPSWRTDRNQGWGKGHFSNGCVKERSKWTNYMNKTRVKYNTVTFSPTPNHEYEQSRLYIQ